MKKRILLCAAFAMLTLAGWSQAPASPSFDDVLTSRRSIRNYDASKKISEAEVRELMKAVGGNKDRIKNAPVLIVSTFERGKSGFFQGHQTNEVGEGWGAYDNGLSNCYLIMKARAMGFDTLIMGMRDADALRALFNIPENETVMAVIALGYRAEEPRHPVHKALDNVVKFF